MVTTPVRTRPPSPAPVPTPPATDRGRRIREAAFVVGLYVVSIAVALGISAIIVALTHGSPWTVFTALWDGSFNSWGSFGYTLDAAAPLLIVAVGTIVSTRAGLFNIGQEGQLAIGAMVAALVALKIDGPGPLMLVLALLAGAAGGAVWAGISALLRYWRGVEVVISSLLLVFVAFQLLSYSLSTTALLHENAEGASLTESDPLPAGVRLPRLGTYPNANMSTAVILALVLAAVIGIAMSRTTWGFRLKMLGLNPVAARRVGVRAAVLGSAALLVSGACAGLAGSVVLTSQAYRITPTISNNIGWNGLLVALVARNNAWVAIGVAILFGGLHAGGGFLASTGVPSDLVDIVEALVVLAAVFPPALLELRRRRARPQAVPAGEAS
jgi:general nucleoside transport system permease protein